MNIRRRVSKLEEVAKAEVTVFIFTTHYEDENGEIDFSDRRGFIDWGKGRCVQVRQTPDESRGEFERRLEDLKAMNFERATARVSEAETS